MTAPAGPTAVVLDVEGTTTPMDFVYGVLFPFARARIKRYFEANIDAPELRQIVDALRGDHRADVAQQLSPPPWSANEQLDDLVGYVHWLMDRDRKSTALKRLQGKIWEQGYRDGALKGAVFDDVPRVFARWAQGERRVAIFSSGSALAQRLLFAYSSAGDLTPYIRDYFDTTLGPKVEAESYARIAEAIGAPVASVTFVSDVTRELAAARAAGMRSLLSIRPGNIPQSDAHQYPKISSLLEVPD